MIDKEKDKQFLKEFAKKYGNETIYAFINEEWSYGHYGRNMDSPGPTPKYNGAPGFAKSIPSFLLCSLISPPLAGIMLLGALVSRLRQKWHTKDSALAMLNPFTWAEYLATGNYIPKGMDKPFWTAGTNAKPNQINDNKDGSTIVKSISDAQKELYENIPPEDLEKLLFNFHWIYFDNGEIRKVLCTDNVKDGTVYAKMMMNPKIVGVPYEKLNELLKAKPACSVYICEYDDGQIIYTVADSEKGARDMADHYIVDTIGKQLKESDNKHVYEIPALKYVTKTDADAVPAMKTMIKFTGQMPIHTDANPLKTARPDKTKTHFWEIGNFMQYKIYSNIGLHFHIPAEPDSEDKQAREIAKLIFNDKNIAIDNYISRLKEVINGNIKNCYSIKTPDNDKYIIPANDEKDALTIAKEMSKAKLQAIYYVMDSGQKAEIDKIVSTMNNISFNTSILDYKKFSEFKKRIEKNVKKDIIIKGKKEIFRTNTEEPAKIDFTMKY